MLKKVATVVIFYLLSSLSLHKVMKVQSQQSLQFLISS